MELFHLAEGRPAKTDRGETAPAKRQGGRPGGHRRGGEPHAAPGNRTPRLGKKPGFCPPGGENRVFDRISFYYLRVCL